MCDVMRYEAITRLSTPGKCVRILAMTAANLFVERNFMASFLPFLSFNWQKTIRRVVGCNTSDEPHLLSSTHGEELHANCMRMREDESTLIKTAQQSRNHMPCTQTQTDPFPAHRPQQQHMQVQRTTEMRWLAMMKGGKLDPRGRKIPLQKAVARLTTEWRLKDPAGSGLGCYCEGERERQSWQLRSCQGLTGQTRRTWTDSLLRQ